MPNVNSPKEWFMFLPGFMFCTELSILAFQSKNLEPRSWRHTEGFVGRCVYTVKLQCKHPLLWLANIAVLILTYQSKVCIKEFLYWRQNCLHNCIPRISFFFYMSLYSCVWHAQLWGLLLRTIQRSYTLLSSLYKLHIHCCYSSFVFCYHFHFSLCSATIVVIKLQVTHIFPVYSGAKKQNKTPWCWCWTTKFLFLYLFL